MRVKRAASTEGIDSEEDEQHRGIECELFCQEFPPPTKQRPFYLARSKWENGSTGTDDGGNAIGNTKS